MVLCFKDVEWLDKQCFGISDNLNCGREKVEPTSISSYFGFH